jgi:ParB family chromosome partitioning protein
MNTATSLKEYVEIPMKELVESSTNPRKSFDEAALVELAESIRAKGVLSPLLARKNGGKYEIITGARRFRAAQSAGLDRVPVRLALDLTDDEVLEIQIIENVVRSDVHPFEEAQGFRALLDRATGAYTIEKIAAKTGKAASYIAKRIKLLDLIPTVAAAFTAKHIGIEHALLLAKLSADSQEKALAHCFDGYFAGNDEERSLVPVGRLQAWIEHNVYLSLKSVPFSKDDATLVPEAGSCEACPNRTGFNSLLFSEVRENSCTDAVCFNNKLDHHIAHRMQKMPQLVMISDQFNISGETPIIPRKNYVEVISRKTKNGAQALPQHSVCSHLTPAIFADGMDKGRLVKVCADLSCTIHFPHRQKEEKQRLQLKAAKAVEKRKDKRTLTFRHRLMADVLKKVKPQLGTEEMRIIARFLLRSLRHDLAKQLAKRHGLQDPKDANDWKTVEKARTLYKKADARGIAQLIFEAILLDCVNTTNQNMDDDPLTDAAALYKIDAKALRAAVAHAGADKEAKKAAKKKGNNARKAAA